jgi:ribonuclease HII
MPDMEREMRVRATGVRLVAGIDEAGRGPLAGPVVAAAVILPDGFAHETLNDSKKLKAAERERIHAELESAPGVFIGVGEASVAEIDRLNILRATHLAMERAVRSLPELPDFCLIDGWPVPRFPVPHEGVVGGDALSLSIAAASVVAKVVRDRWVMEVDAEWPQYAFAKHKGYGTELHLQLIRKHGPCPLHRRSFEPIAQPTFDF